MFVLLFGAYLSLPIAAANRPVSTPADLSACEGSCAVGNIGGIVLTMKAIRLLNGREDPRLLHVLQTELELEASNVSASVSGGASASSYPAVLSLSHGVRDAVIYARERQLSSSLLRDLEVVDSWVTKELARLRAEEH